MQDLTPTPETPPILVIEDDPGHLRTLADILENEGLQPIGCQTGQAALAACEQSHAHVAILDLRLTDMDGLQLLDLLLQTTPNLKIIIHTGYASLDTAMAAVNRGAFAYVEKVGNVEELLPHVHRAFHQHLMGYSEILEQEVQKRTQELMSANDALRESEERFRNLIEGSVQGILIHRDNRALFVNQAYADIFGYETPDAIYELDSLAGLIADHEQERLLGYQKAQLAGEPVPTYYEYQGVRQDGSLAWLDMQVRVIAWEGAAAIQSTVVDVTDRKRLETQLLQAHKMEAIGTLAGGIAHDFNNVLGAIFMYAELSKTYVNPDGELWGNLQGVLTAAARAKDLVRQILTFSRQTETMRRPVQLGKLIQDMLGLLRASLPTTIEIRHDLSEIGDTILADPTQIHQIILNLCVNAEHAMRETGGFLEIHVAPVDIDDAFARFHHDLQPGPYARLTIRDSGQGMTQETLERIFDPFFTTKDIGDGTGMGLAMVHGIITSYEGAITVESAPGQGTTFAIYFPRSEAPVEDQASVNAVMPHGSGHILVVDDEPAFTRSLSVLLGMLGYEVTMSVGSQEALDMFCAAPQNFDLVITDQTMPNLTGEQLVQGMRRLRADIPIILCTGYSHVMNAEKAQALGVDAFCMKPMTAQDFADR